MKRVQGLLAIGGFFASAKPSGPFLYTPFDIALEKKNAAFLADEELLNELAKHESFF